jgi:hypothetical protein
MKELVLLLLAQDESPRDSFVKRCQSCHFVPDLSIERDRVWLDLIKTTA